MEAFLVQGPQVTGQAHKARSLQLVVGHEPGTALEHYHKESLQLLSAKLQGIIKEPEKKINKKENKDENNKKEKK